MASSHNHPSPELKLSMDKHRSNTAELWESVETHTKIIFFSKWCRMKTGLKNGLKRLPKSKRELLRLSEKLETTA